MTASARWNAAIAALYISCAVTTRTTFTPAGSARSTGPATRTTSCPRATAAAAQAKPMRPLEGFEIKRTSSMNSRVGPAVTRNRTGGIYDWGSAIDNRLAEQLLDRREDVRRFGQAADRVGAAGEEALAGL